jgi:hypothetical protein
MSGLEIVEQDTRQAKYFVLGGTEISFRFPLPFCASCSRSAKRHPKTIFHRALVFLIAFGAAFLGLIVVGDVMLSIPGLSQHLTVIAFAIATLITGLLIIRSKPKGKQTSYFQPVRINKLKREFVSGKVTGIRLAFTNREYAGAFAHANQAAVNRKTVEAVAA